MCAICDQFSAQLFEIDSQPRKVPVLCNITSSMKSHQSKVGDCRDFCTKLWDKCGNISLLSSPFAPSSQGRMTDHWQSTQDICEAFGGSEDAVCFNGVSVSFSQVDAAPPPAGLCLEKIGNGTYINLVPHPDGSNRAFVSNQQGQIWLATVPDEGSSGILGINEAEPFLDITDQVLFGTEFGQMSMAFHPTL
ncbi:putative six-bladed beta-propeller, TolB [Rosa chinensis]|uniref:Putative six-bladed beta-propeller, TolB n=1 Tax=Rosa chinensis TaxID=74649 RepID=A0A2P6P2A5_ROSCH|nr:putative six-bladed beta-propeller, TolB [Rosa chinensis]